MAPRVRLTKSVLAAAAAAIGQRGGQARAKALTAKRRSEIARAAGLASGWPKGKKRGPSPLKGRKVVR